MEAAASEARRKTARNNKTQRVDFNLKITVPADTRIFGTKHRKPPVCLYCEKGTLD